MAETTLNIKLRCKSWQQFATIYKRDLSRGTMFLKAASRPALGTIVRIDLELPSATIVELKGAVAEHVADGQRGTGVELKLEALPAQTVWLIENALAAGGDSIAQRPPEAEASAASVPGVAEGEAVVEAEAELVRALEAEADSLKKLNPFLVLGLQYETTDDEVRAAFGELTKRYHPDRYARYQSTKLRQLAAEIFILIRDAYRKVADDAVRAQTRSALGLVSPPKQAGGPPRPPGGPPKSPAGPPKPPPKQVQAKPVAMPAPASPVQPPPEAPAATAAQPVRSNEPKPPAPVVGREPPPPAKASATSSSETPGEARADRPATDAGDSSLESLIDGGKLDDALAAYRVLAKKNPQDRTARAGIELVEGYKALQARDRLEAAQRFEAALEIDPSNERAARELADMRRQATNERKGLLSRLMKKEGAP